MLKGLKVTLRPIENADLEFLVKWKNDHEVFKNLGGGYMPVSSNQHAKWMEGFIDTTGNNKRFIIENSNHKSVGLIGIYSINWISRNCELGMYIGEKDEWGKGIASEALDLIINFCSQVLNLRKIKLLVVENNIGAIKLYEKNHFKTVGILQQERFIDGLYKDVRIMEKLI